MLAQMRRGADEGLVRLQLPYDFDQSLVESLVVLQPQSLQPAFALRADFTAL